MNYRIELNKLLVCVINLIALFVAVLSNSMMVIGVIIIVVSILALASAKGNKLLSLLLGIIAFINCSVAIGNCIYRGKYAPIWQKNGLLSTKFDVATSKSILITICILSIIIALFSRAKNNTELTRRKPNAMICVLLITTLMGILALAVIEFVGRRGAGYSSVSNPIFEYSTIVIMILWLYSGEKTDYFIKIYTIVFCAIFLLIGDRSCAFTILILAFILFYSKRINAVRTIFLFIVAICIANAVAYLRNDSSATIGELISYVVQRGIYLDTITWSYYASVTISALSSYVVQPWRFIFGYALYFVTGISTTYSGMSNFSKNNFSDLYNMGGGIYSSYFYGMAGYFGVVIGAILLGIIIVKVFNSQKKNAAVYQILIVALSLRWYLYSISTLYRGLLVLTTIALLGCGLLDTITNRNNLRRDLNGN